MSSQPEIPDAISLEALTALLGQRQGLPISPAIPMLDLGGTLGGPCDLQFVVSQVIHRSTNGTNLVQMLVAACHLLTEAEAHFEEQFTRLAGEQPPYDRATAEEQAMVRRLLTAHIHHVQLAIAQLEPLLKALSGPMYRARIQQLQQGPFADLQQLPLDVLRSHLLISDELLASLQVPRDAVTTYLDAHTDDT